MMRARFEVKARVRADVAASARFLSHGTLCRTVSSQIP